MYNLGNQFKFNLEAALMNSECIFKGEKYRISILTPNLIRLEYNVSGVFNDLPTFDKDTVLYHYGSMVNNFWNKYVIGHEGMGKRVTKRYLYCIRCILSYILLKEHNISDVPINIFDLLAYFEEDNDIIHNILLDDIYQLIDYYKNSCENYLSEESIFNLSSFIDKYNKTIGKSIFHKTGFKNLNSYNQRFQELILYG